MVQKKENAQSPIELNLADFEKHCLQRVHEEAREFAEKNGCEFTSEIENEFLIKFLAKLKKLNPLPPRRTPLRPKSEMINNLYCYDLKSTQAFLIDETSEHMDAALHAFAREFGASETIKMIALMREGFEVRFRDYANEMQNELEGLSDEE